MRRLVAGSARVGCEGMTIEVGRERVAGQSRDVLVVARGASHPSARVVRHLDSI
jgi:hypothetical protein